MPEINTYWFHCPECKAGNTVVVANTTMEMLYCAVCKHKTTGWGSSSRLLFGTEE